MLAAFLAMGISGAVLPVSDIFPEAKDFRFQEIRKAADEKDWPFVADSGTLMCTYILKEPTVYFATSDEEKRTQAVHINTDLMQMAFVNLGQQGVLKPFDSPEQLYNRIFPYVDMGKRLCQQPPGTRLTAPEL